MTSTIYLYIWLDGEMKQTSVPPTKECYESIVAGDLEIVLFEEGKFSCVDENNERYNIEEIR